MMKGRRGLVVSIGATAAFPSLSCASGGRKTFALVGGFQGRNASPFGLGRYTLPITEQHVITAMQQKRHFQWNILAWYRENATTEKQKLLKQEIERGYWGDANELLVNPKGRLWPTPTKAFKKKDSQPFPLLSKSFASWQPFDKRVSLEQVTKKEGPILLLLSVQRLYAFGMLDAWRKPFEKAFPDVPVYELETVQQLAYWFFNPVLRMAYFKKHTERERWPRMLYYNGIMKTKSMRWTLGLHNRLVGYALLLDEEGLVRWKASGFPDDPADLDAMRTAMQQLLDERKKQKNSSSKSEQDSK